MQFKVGETRSNMNINCGTDIIEIDRIKESIENLGDKFLR